MSLLSSFVWVFLSASAFMGALGNLEGQNCTDVSYYKPVVYNPVNYTCCTSKVKTECVETMEKKWMVVEEMKCEVVGWSECKMEDCPVTVADPKPVYTEFTGSKCDFVPYIIHYNKTLPVCHNETKRICTTLWERDANGDPVWNGKEDCKNVTWLVCHPMEKPHNITTIISVCEPLPPVKYKTCENSTSSEIHMCTKCEAKAASDCHVVKTNKTVEVMVKSCKPVATDICKPCEYLVPSQEYVHQERCLLPLGETRHAGDHHLDHHQHEHHHHVHDQHHHEEDPSGRTRHAVHHHLDHHHEHGHHHQVVEEEKIDIMAEEETRLKHGIDLPEQSPQIIEKAVKVVVNESPVEAEATPSFNTQHFPGETADGVWTVDDEALARARNFGKSEHETASSPQFSANPPVFSYSSEKEPAVGRVLRASESGCKSCRLAGYEAAGSTEV